MLQRVTALRKASFDRSVNSGVVKAVQLIHVILVIDSYFNQDKNSSLSSRK